MKVSHVPIHTQIHTPLGGCCFARRCKHHLRVKCLTREHNGKGRSGICATDYTLCALTRLQWRRFKLSGRIKEWNLVYSSCVIKIFLLAPCISRLPPLGFTSTQQTMNGQQLLSKCSILMNIIKVYFVFENCPSPLKTKFFSSVQLAEVRQNVVHQHWNTYQRISHHVQILPKSTPMLQQVFFLSVFKHPRQWQLYTRIVQSSQNNFNKTKVLNTFVQATNLF